MEHVLEVPVSPPAPPPSAAHNSVLVRQNSGAAVNQGNIVVLSAPHPQFVCPLCALLLSDMDKEPASIISRPRSKRWIIITLFKWVTNASHFKHSWRLNTVSLYLNIALDSWDKDHRGIWMDVKPLVFTVTPIPSHPCPPPSLLYLPF